MFRRERVIAAPEARAIPLVYHQCYSILDRSLESNASIDLR